MHRRVMLVGLLGLVGCYDLPTPSCGFVCGADNACPDDYACSAFDGVCHRVDDETQMTCPGVGAPVLDRPTIVRYTGQFGEQTMGEVVVAFSREVTGVDRTSFTLVHTNGGQSVDGTVTSGLQGDEYIATFTATSSLVAGASYAAHLSNAIRDREDDASEPLGWSVRAYIDEQPPSLTFLMPSPNEVNVSVATGVSVFFDEPVEGITETSFSLLIDGMVVPAALTASATSANLSPISQLTPATTYNVLLTPAITDLRGNALPPASWTFTTGDDTVPPSALLVAPSVPGATALDAQFVLQFNEPMLHVDATTFQLAMFGGELVAATVTYDEATRTATLVPASPLQASTSYTLTLSLGATDRQGNAFPGFAIGIFTTSA